MFILLSSFVLNFFKKMSWTTDVKIQDYFEINKEV